jgi:hypothetical protein
MPRLGPVGAFATCSLRSTSVSLVLDRTASGRIAWIGRRATLDPSSAVMRRTVGLLLLAPLLLAPSCNPYACIYRTRFVATAGTASAPAVGRVTVESLNFRDYTAEAQTPVMMAWVVRGEGLAAAPVALTLRDARNPARVVKSLSFQHTSATSFTSGSSLDVAPGERDQMFELLNGNAVVVLELANGSSLTVPVTVTTRENWHRPSCD